MWHFEITSASTFSIRFERFTSFRMRNIIYIYDFMLNAHVSIDSQMAYVSCKNIEKKMFSNMKKCRNCMLRVFL